LRKFVWKFNGVYMFVLFQLASVKDTNKELLGIFLDSFFPDLSLMAMPEL
jgi:hypothetical protein